ncbi:MAG: formylglycine-generating enzyme family protein [Nitrospirae bacterium]|nr:MAG: formylglycine-generating enzyme family protein [Nitrospirota bacterium]
MRRMMSGTVLTIVMIAAGIVVGQARSAQAADYHMIPGLSAQDRIVLAKSLVEQDQCRNGLIEITEAMKELPNDETLIRLKATCEVELLQPGAKDTIMKWLKLAPQGHAERGKMLALLAKSQQLSATAAEWVLVPAGEFEMGAEGAPAGPDEAPKHKVTLDAFYIGKYEVTNRQYQAFVKTTGHRPPDNPDGPKYSIWKGTTPLDGTAELPVINVSWNDAVAYCKWVGGRLPTEAEWEKAARGTDGRTYPWGNDPVTGNRSNYGIEGVTFWEGPTTLAKKDQYDFGKSPYGAYEMAGNVWEWVQDWYDENYYKNSPAQNPTGPAEGKTRVMRGGSWRDQPDIVRAANRNKHLPDERRTYIGIRCAKDAK